jgi:hypothetical protein
MISQIYVLLLPQAGRQAKAGKGRQASTPPEQE